MGQEHGLV